MHPIRPSARAGWPLPAALLAAVLLGILLFAATGAPLVALVATAVLAALLYAAHRLRRLLAEPPASTDAQSAPPEAPRELERSTPRHDDELAAASQQLAAIGHALSHDLRAPLRAVDGYSATLLADHAERLDDDGWLLLEGIRRGVHRMSDVVDGLVEFSRVGRAPLERRRVDLSATAKELVQALRDGDPQRSVAVDIEADLHAHADPRLARIVLEQLLDNAWKFTGNTRNARLRVARAVDAAGASCFVVEDNGAGFDMGSMDKLFAPFQRLHADDAFPGAGIGLAIVASILQRHRGWISATSRPGDLTRFFFSFEPSAAPRNK